MKEDLSGDMRIMKMDMQSNNTNNLIFIKKRSFDDSLLSIILIAMVPVCAAAKN